MIFKICEDRVLVKRDEPVKQVGNIVIPDVAQAIPQLATVISVGPGRKLESGELVVPRFKPGDRVVIGKYSGTDIEELIKGEHLCLMRAEEVLMVVENEEVEGLEIVGEGAERYTSPSIVATLEDVVEEETNKIGGASREDSEAGATDSKRKKDDGDGRSAVGKGPAGGAD